MLWLLALIFPFAPSLALVLFCLGAWFRRRFIFHSCLQKSDLFTVAFLHPACAAGGGGEGVLWTCIAALQNYEAIHKRIDKFVIYCDKNSPVSTPEELVSRVRNQFGIQVSHQKLELIPLAFSGLALRPESMPFLTLAFQALFSMLLAVEALWKHQPNILLDTTGLTFALPVFSWLLGKHCKIGAYVHYPWISTNMISVVERRSATFNNRAMVARSSILTTFKLYYYRFLAKAYSYAGCCAEVAMVNSLWTRDHIAEIWSSFPSYNLHVVYPPVNVKPFLICQAPREHDTRTAVYIAQFRPEKNHPFLLESFASFLDSLGPNDPPKERYILKLIGGCRSADDQRRIDDLKRLAAKLAISENVKFCVGLPHGELVDALVASHVAVHPMVDEHFGIAVVEAMAAGLVVVAHESGGPARDILLPPDDNAKQPTGILVPSLRKEDFADALRKGLVEMGDAERDKMTISARRVAEQRFSSARFKDNFLAAVEPLF